MTHRIFSTIPAGQGLAGTDLTRRQFNLVALAFALFIALSVFYLDRLTAGLLVELPRGVILFHRQITKLGLAGPYLIGSIVLACLFWWRARHTNLLCQRLREWARASACLFTFAAVSLSGLIINLIKMFIGRPRPFLYNRDSSIYFDFDPFPISAMWKSFPSGHTNTAFVVALCIGFFMPRLRTPLLALACIVAASRVYIGAHYPSDVLGGAFIAYLTTYSLRHWWEKKYRLPFMAGRQMVGVRGFEPPASTSRT